MSNVSFRENYNKNLNKLFMLAILAHIPVFMALAYYFKTQMWFAIAAPLFILAGPILSYSLKPSSLLTSNIMAIAVMALSASMIHLGKGMIEMHFHIFIFLAFLIVYGYKTPLLSALVTVAVHHISFYFLLPTSLFNYEAPFSVVILHALFAIVSALGCMDIARRFGAFIDMQETVETNLNAAVKSNHELSDKLKRISASITENSTSQTSSIQETVSTLEEISKMVNLTSQNIHKTEKTTNDSFSVAEDGKKSVTSVTQSISEISNSNTNLIQEMNKNMARIKEVTGLVNQIADKTSIINDIVFQTKLLSFNASVEAARAGEHGKGFAVVAEEVGNLASMSGNASEEINNLISTSIDHVNSIVNETQKSIISLSEKGEAVLNDGINKSNDSKKVIDNVVINLRQSTDLMKDIAMASTEQSKGVEEITKTIKTMDRDNHSNIVLISELQNLAQTIENESKNLDLTVRDIQKKLNGKKAA